MKTIPQTASVKPKSRPTRANDPPVPDVLLQHWIEKAKRCPPVRRDLVEHIKAEIASGSYDSPDKLDKALDRLLDELEAR